MGIDRLCQAFSGKNEGRQWVMSRQAGRCALPASARGGDLAARQQQPGVDHLVTGLEKALGEEAVQERAPLARYTALRIGGPADLLVTADDAEALRQSVMLAGEHGVPCRVLGGGSNVLVSDRGVRGLVILNRTRAIDFSPGGVKAESGASFSTLAQRCIALGLGGLEWATGIPGTVGGAVVGNSGAWGSDVATTLEQATVMEPSGRVLIWPVERFDFGYRTSILKRQAKDGGRQTIVLDAKFVLEPAEAEDLAEKGAIITAKRKESQPPGATCGSVFKNPPGAHAGRLIDEAGLKGKSSGKAQISPRHANFIINLGHATATDIKRLIDLAYHTVLARFGVELEMEIELIGEW